MTNYKVDIPEGSVGNFKIEKFEIVDSSAMLFFNLKNPARAVAPGEYTRLLEKSRTVWMSDTPAEQRDHSEPILRASGICRVHGLGIGMVTAAMLEKPSVEKVEVVELYQEVIDLVGPTLKARYGDRLEIIQGNALELKPSSALPNGYYTVIWHDIWPAICRENLNEIKRLHKTWKRVAQWQESWARKECSR